MIKDALQKLVIRTDLSRGEVEACMEEIMEGQASPAQIAAFITALRMKGETVEELTGGAATMRKHATTIDAGGRQHVVDIVGTGGDAANTFNISTAAAFVAAGAGLCIAKHGNRAVSSKCGAADVLAELGVNLDATADVMEKCLQENGICFLFAQKLHPAMKHAAPVRRDLGIRTIFNMLGPLTNPANANCQVLGVYDATLTETFANVFRQLGCHRAMVVHGLDGLDEISTVANTRISELRNGQVRTYELSPETIFGRLASPADLVGGGPAENAAILRAVLENTPGPCRDIVQLNAAAAIMVGEQADTLEEALKLADDSITSGAALNKLEALVKATN